MPKENIVQRRHSPTFAHSGFTTFDQFWIIVLVQGNTEILRGDA